MAANKWTGLNKKNDKIVQMGIRYYGDNWHTNFKDLNPGWAQKRHERAVNHAKKIVDKMTLQLKGRYENEELKVFEK